MEQKIFSKEICEYLAAMPQEYAEILKSIIINNYYRNVRKIIEENTEKYSVFHYDNTHLVSDKNGVCQWNITEIASQRQGIMDSNKNFMELPEYKKEYSEKDCEYANEQIQKILLNWTKEKNIDLRPLISFCARNEQVVIKNTQLLEHSEIPHSIFDYKSSYFFTNGNNKRFYALQQKENEKYGLINAKGELVVPFIYDYVGPFAIQNLIHIEKDGLYGLIDCLGNIAVKPISDTPLEFFGGLSVVRRNKKCGFINMAGKIVIPIIYDAAGYFEYGKVQVVQGEKQFYINRLGEKIENC